MSRLFKLRRHVISNIQFEKNKKESRKSTSVDYWREQNTQYKFNGLVCQVCKLWIIHLQNTMNNYRIKTVHILCNNISIFINSTTKCIIWITNWSKKNAKKQWVKHAYRWYSLTQLHKKINRRLKLLRFILLN